MRMIEVLKDMAFGAGTAGLKVAGSMAFPGAWPLIEAALEPVLDRLKDRFKTADPLDAANAQAAWAELLADGSLGALFEERLEAAAAPLRASHQQLEEGQRRLLQILDGNAEILEVICKDLERMQSSGVRIAEPSLEAIRSAVGQELAESIRSLEQRLSQFPAEHADAERRQQIRSRFRDQLARAQARAVELLGAGDFDRAADELRSGIESLSLLIEEAPEDVDLRVNLGYYYKTIAATFASVGSDKVPASIDRDQVVDEFNERAMTIFYFVAHGIEPHRKTVGDQTHAVNGIGNIHYARREYRLAIDNYVQATQIDPYNYNAWHDLFLAHYSLALQGRVDFPAMQHALERTRETGQGQPGLGARRLQELDRLLETFDPDRITDRLVEEALRLFPTLNEVAENPLPDTRSDDDDDDLTRALRALRRGAPERAREALTSVVEDFDQGRSADARRAASALCHLGSLLAPTDAEAAHRHYLRATELAPEWADAWHDLGSILTHIKRQSDAASAFLRSAIQARAHGNQPLQLFALENMATALCAEPGSAALAIRVFRGLLYAYHSTAERESLLRVYWKLVELDSAFGNFAEAENYARTAMDLAEGRPSVQVQFVWILAALAEHRQERERALALYRRALLLFEETGPEDRVERAAEKVRELEAGS
jgi:tetratricopeptide (TPR) repeat protein